MRTALVNRWPQIARFGPLVFGLASVTVVATLGFPDQRDVLAVWLLLGLLAFSLRDLSGWVQGVVRDWAPFFGLLVAYDAVRGAAKGLAPVHYLPQAQADRVMFGGHTPTQWLQARLWNGHVRWYDAALGLVYLTHFFAVPVLAAVLWKRDRAHFRRLVAVVATLSGAALITYALYPAAPPWMATQAALLPGVTRIFPHVWSAIDVHFAGSMIEGGYRYANDVAAVPSIHSAFALVVAIALWPRVRRRSLRALIVLYPIAMALALVYGGEHYVSDVLLGWLYAAGAVLAVRTFMRARVRRSESLPGRRGERAVEPSPALSPR